MYILPTIYPVTCHTDFVGNGSTFVAIKGFSRDGAFYIKEAVQKGATTIVVAHETVISDELLQFLYEHVVTLQRVADTRIALAQLSAQAADFHAQKLKIFGITGTKGKTTTAYLVAAMLKRAGFKTALLSSEQNMINDQAFAASLTTPQPDYIHQFLKVCVDAGITHVVLEVAAQALSLHRVEGILFDGIIFTNFSHTHLEFYESIDDYWQAKCKIFKLAKEKSLVLINADDANCQKIMTREKIIFTCSSQQNASIIGIQQSLPSESLKGIIHINEHVISIAAPALYGIYNFYNVVAAAGFAFLLGISTEAIAQTLFNFAGVPGRCERYLLPNNVTCIIDKAHNPSSFQSILHTMRQMTDHLIVVTGAG